MPAKPNIRPGLWRDIVDNKIVHVVGLALDETDLCWLVLWRHEDDKQIWAKKVTHWNTRIDGNKRFEKVKD